MALQRAGLDHFPNTEHCHAQNIPLQLLGTISRHKAQDAANTTNQDTVRGVDPAICYEDFLTLSQTF